MTERTELTNIDMAFAEGSARCTVRIRRVYVETGEQISVWRGPVDVETAAIQAGGPPLGVEDQQKLAAVIEAARS